MLRTSYCLVGLPYSGKTYIGQKIALTNNKGFIDTDHIIKYKYNTDLNNIIRDNGIKKFINIENEVLKTIHCENTILSSGGSSVYSDMGMNHIKYTLNCDIIHLHLSFTEFNKRVTDLNKRGVINPNNLSLKELYNERINLCNYYSDININADNKMNLYNKLLNIIE